MVVRIGLAGGVLDAGAGADAGGFSGVWSSGCGLWLALTRAGSTPGRASFFNFSSSRVTLIWARV